MSRRSALINVMVSAVMKAARGLRRDFNEVEKLQVSMKGPADFVSTADMRAEQVLREELARARPDYGFLLEESGAVAGVDADAPRWLVDPLDGTTNFLHGLPHWALTVAVEHSGEILAGVTYDPLREELFWAERGKGAYLNDYRLRVSARNRLETALIATGIPFKGRPGFALFERQLAALAPQVSGIRRFGSAALDLAYVAAGRYDGFWEAHLGQWDIAAGLLLVGEAGGYVSDYRGRGRMLSTGEVVAAGADLHDSLLRQLKRAEDDSGAAA